MYKTCQTEQSLKRQRELEAGLLQMMLKQRYEDITVSDLCAQMQIPRKSFYRYFASKEGALHALIDHTIADFYDVPPKSKKPRGSAVDDLNLYFSFWYEHRTFLDALQRNALSGVLVQRANQFALNEGLLPRQFKQLKPEVRYLAMAFSVCGLMSMVLSWHEQGYHIPPEEMSRLTIHMLTNPLITH